MTVARSSAVFGHMSVVEGIQYTRHILFLVDLQLLSLPVSGYPTSQEPLYLSQVIDLEVPQQFFHHPLLLVQCRRCEEQIINAHPDNGQLSVSSPIIHAPIALASGESHLGVCLMYAKIPLSPGLAQAVQTLHEFPEPFPKLWRYLHVDFFVEFAIQVCGLDIQVVEFEPQAVGDGHDYPQYLREAFCHETRSEARYVPILVTLSLQDPSPFDSLPPRW